MAPINSAVIGVSSTKQDQATDETSFRLGIEPQPNDVFIGVMGVTGAGKSTFIKSLTGLEGVKIGHGLQSCTQEMTPYLYRYNDNTNVYLIDTPGFDDTYRSDVDVLLDITEWLSDSFGKGVKLSGMLYFHRITDVRMQGSSHKNLAMFKALCGIAQFRNVILITTMWEHVSKHDGLRRETQLKETEDFWKCMIQEGSITERYYNNRASAKRIVEIVLEKEIGSVELEIQTEIVKERRELHDTTAGKTLEAEIIEERKKWEREEAKRRADSKRASEQQKAELEAEMRKLAEKARKQAEGQKAELERLKKRWRDADLRAEKERKRAEQQEEEQRELRRRHEEQESTVPKSRSHPGPNRIQECRSVTLVDDAYFFCGPDRNESKLLVNVQNRLSVLGFDDIEPQSSKPGFFARTFKPMFEIPLGDGVRAFALGTSGSFYVHHHQKGSCKEIAFLPDYPGLKEALAKYKRHDGKTSFGCPRYLSLGVNGHYFIKSKSRTAWDLPKDLLEQSWWHSGNVKAVWLGMHDAWVVELTDGTAIQDLKGQYSTNENLLERKVQSGFGSKRAGHRIKAMALSLTNPESYIAIWGNGSILCSAVGGFNQFVFEEFATKNFGTRF